MNNKKVRFPVGGGSNGCAATGAQISIQVLHLLPSEQKIEKLNNNIYIYSSA